MPKKWYYDGRRSDRTVGWYLERLENLAREDDKVLNSGKPLSAEARAALLDHRDRLLAAAETLRVTEGIRERQYHE